MNKHIIDGLIGDCPVCGKTRSLVLVEWKQRRPPRPMLHCTACELYLDYFGPCSNCGAVLFLTDADVDTALDGGEVPCAKCGYFLNLSRFQVGRSTISLRGSLVPELHPALEFAEESEFVCAAKAYLSESRDEQQRLGVYHRTTCFRWRAASQYLQRIQTMAVPFGIDSYNYDPAAEEQFDETGESQLFELDARLFDYVVNARSTLDVLAHEINFVYRVAGPPDYRDRFSDPADPRNEQKVSVESLRRLIDESHPDPLWAFLREQLSSDWFRYLTDLRDVAYHRRLLVGAQEALYAVKDFLRTRPTRIKPVAVTMRLPDDPKAPWWTYSFSRGYELVPRLEAVHEGVGEFLRGVYRLLAAKLREEEPEALSKVSP